MHERQARRSEREMRMAFSHGVQSALQARSGLAGPWVRKPHSDAFRLSGTQGAAPRFVRRSAEACTSTHLHVHMASRVVQRVLTRGSTTADLGQIVGKDLCTCPHRVNAPPCGSAWRHGLEAVAGIGERTESASPRLAAISPRKVEPSVNESRNVT